MAAIPIHTKPSALRGEIPLESRPAGIANANAARIPGFQSIELASLVSFGWPSTCGYPFVPSAVYTSCGNPQLGQKQLCAVTV
jgi:hypothetical protein